ncbi:MAG: pseudaminic acid cytidylyltransferase [Kiloniellales bacterium]
MNLAVIPARSGSTRIKDKNVTDLCGKPLIAYPLQAARDSGLFDTIHVSTDSDRYAEIVRGLGFEVEFLRDPALAGNQVGMIDVLRWVVGAYAKRGRGFDDVCMIMATAPLIEAEDLKRGYALFVEHERHVPVLAVAPFAAAIERGFRIGESGVLDPMFPEKRALHSQDLTPAYHDAGAFFFIDAGRLMADTVEVYNQMLPLVLPRHKAVDIDEPEDLETAEILFRGRAALRESTEAV